MKLTPSALTPWGRARESVKFLSSRPGEREGSGSARLMFCPPRGRSSPPAPLRKKLRLTDSLAEGGSSPGPGRSAMGPPAWALTLTGTGPRTLNDQLRGPGGRAALKASGRRSSSEGMGADAFEGARKAIVTFRRTKPVGSTW
ncbi:MAG: hypothetical protein C4339_01570 [Nitrososphaerota archaeon]